MEILRTLGGISKERSGLFNRNITIFKRSPPEVFLGNGVLKMCSKSTGKDPCRSVISVKLLCIFIEITLRHGCSPVNLLHFFRTPLPKNTSGGLLNLLCPLTITENSCLHCP